MKLKNSFIIRVGIFSIILIALIAAYITFTDNLNFWKALDEVLEELYIKIWVIFENPTVMIILGIIFLLYLIQKYQPNLLESIKKVSVGSLTTEFEKSFLGVVEEQSREIEQKEENFQNTDYLKLYAMGFSTQMKKLILKIGNKAFTNFEFTLLLADHFSIFETDEYKKLYFKNGFTMALLGVLPFHILNAKVVEKADTVWVQKIKFEVSEEFIEIIKSELEK